MSVILVVELVAKATLQPPMSINPSVCQSGSKTPKQLLSNHSTFPSSSQPYHHHTHPHLIITPTILKNAFTTNFHLLISRLLSFSACSFLKASLISSHIIYERNNSATASFFDVDCSFCTYSRPYALLICVSDLNCIH